jgi:hypothetical protein
MKKAAFFDKRGPGLPFEFPPSFVPDRTDIIMARSGEHRKQKSTVLRRRLYCFYEPSPPAPFAQHPLGAPVLGTMVPDRVEGIYAIQHTKGHNPYRVLREGIQGTMSIRGKMMRSCYNLDRGELWQLPLTKVL